MKQPYQKKELRALIAAIEEIRADALALAERNADQLRGLPAEKQASGRNLLHYLALRQRDIRPLQEALHQIGLSSLGRVEPYVLPSLDAVLVALRGLIGESLPRRKPSRSNRAAATALLESRSAALLGPATHGARRIMVTLPNPDADRPGLLEDLLDAGMNVMRVNCAKGDPDAWRALLDRLRAAEKRSGHHCRVLFDLEGPNPRTGPMRKKLRLTTGDELLLQRGNAKARKLKRDPTSNAILRPARVSVDLDEIFRAAKPGQSVVFDDGKIEGAIAQVDDSGILVRITKAEKGSAKLGPGKGINFPDTDLDLPSLMEKDLRDLDFVAHHADLVGLSFVRRPEDVVRLQDELAKRGSDLGIVLKIETRASFEALPNLLLAALRSPSAGVMIARGDMAAELGFARTAEVQEEILWLCEAAQAPVIWATQVLENLSKKGVPTRGETSDAALGVRAECVMLNKGAHVVEAVRFLSGLLDRMADHRLKKWSLLRKLDVASLDN